jgi:hypothetical protein
MRTGIALPLLQYVLLTFKYILCKYVLKKGDHFLEEKPLLWERRNVEEY